MHDHAQRQHAPWGGSGAARWSVCTAQPDAAAKQSGPRRETRYTLEGTLAHEILSTCLLNGVAPTAIAPTDAIAFSVQVVIDYICAVQAQYPDLIVISEEFLFFPQDVLPRDDVGGSPDVLLWSPSARRGWVIDFKHGEGVDVKPHKNLQLWFYAAAYFHDKPVIEVELVIIQPRSPNPAHALPDPEIITAYDIAEHIAEVDAILRGPRVFVAGPHCKWCPLQPTCETHEDYMLAAAREILAGVKSVADIDTGLPDPAALGRARVGKILELHEDRWAPFISACREYAYGETKSGEWVPGWKLVEAQARRRWHGDPMTIAGELMNLSGHALGIEDVMPRKLMTITDAEERLAAIAVASAPHGQKTHVRKQIKDALAQLTLKETSGNLTLVRDDDKRSGTNAAKQMLSGVSLPPIAPPVSAPAGMLAAPPSVAVVAAAPTPSHASADFEAWERLRQRQQQELGYYYDAR